MWPLFSQYFLGILLCGIGIYAPSLSKYFPGDVAYLRLVFPGIFLGWYYVAYPRLFPPSIFLGMVLCGIIVPSLFKYFPGDGIMWRLFPNIFIGMVLCGIGISGYPRPGDGIMWHICA